MGDAYDGYDPLDQPARASYEDEVEQMVGSPTPALDAVMAAQYAVEGSPAAEVGAIEPEVYFAAALEAYDLLGQTLSEAGSMYLLMGSMLGAIEPQGTGENDTAP